LHEEAKKKKKGKGIEEFDPEKVVPRLEDKDVAKIVKRRINMTDCLNKGYILDGVLKTHAQLEAVFLNENG
jgi:adenylate kinase family enzyme